MFISFLREINFFYMFRQVTTKQTRSSVAKMKTSYYTLAWHALKPFGHSTDRQYNSPLLPLYFPPSRSSAGKTKTSDCILAWHAMKPFDYITAVLCALHAAHAQFSGQEEHIRLYAGLNLEVQLNRSYISVSERWHPQILIHHNRGCRFHTWNLFASKC